MQELTLSNPSLNIKNAIKAGSEAYPDKPIVAELSAAQAILESGLREKPSKLALQGNNLFGITKKGNDGSILLKTKEFEKGHWIEKIREFAKFKTLKDSFEKHRSLMEKGTADKPDRYKKVLEAKTFQEAAHAIKAGGWATDPGYDKKLIEIYTQYIRGKND